ncbi:hypothetical protein [Rhodococcus erythropolis]|uniref:hypothetical protein n=1 Tax=Rhodococcus erythropolis TaxID=1833 RepID=UPI001BE935EE|nr:hypothetical protein [Rhodococcus erythropolis]MBT2263901.1 hypothetical protein [Rhodococcus erythropolis]
MTCSRRLAWGAVSFGAAMLLVTGCGADSESPANPTNPEKSTSLVVTTASSAPGEMSPEKLPAASPGNEVPGVVSGGGGAAASGGQNSGGVPGSAGDGGAGAVPGDQPLSGVPGSAGDGGSGLAPGEPSAAGTYCGPGYNELAVWSFGPDCDTAMAVQAGYGAQLVNSDSKSATVDAGGFSWVCGEYAGQINPYLECSSNGGAVRLTS